MGTFAFCLAATYQPASVARLNVLADPFYSPFSRAWEFGIGSLAAFASSRVEAGRIGSAAASLTGAILILFAGLTFSGGMTFPGIAACVPVGGAALLLLSNGDTGVGRVLGHRSLVWIGDLSYGWYLWHWPLIVIGRYISPASAATDWIAVMVSLGAAYVSRRFVEDPIRYASPFTRRDFVRLVGGPAMAGIAVSGGLGQGARLGWGQDWALGSHVALRRDCDDTFDPVRCRWTAPNSRGVVLLVGDSQAWALADGLIPAASAIGYDTIVATYNACPVILPSADGRHPPFLSPDCAARNERILQTSLAIRPAVVVLANQSAAYAAPYQDVWRTALATTLERLHDAGSRIVLVSVTPIGDERSRRTSLLLRGAPDRSSRGADNEPFRAASVAVDRLVAADRRGVVLFDPAEVLCMNGQCTVAQSGRELYSDQSHLSRFGSLLLAPALKRSLETADNLS
jgi:hypothetical protein